MPPSKPCVTPATAEGLNIATVAAGKWYLTKLYNELLKPGTEAKLPTCIQGEFSATVASGEGSLTVSAAIGAEVKGTSVPITMKSNGEAALTFKVQAPAGPGGGNMELPLNTKVND
jgi:hypothetical protein